MLLCVLCVLLTTGNYENSPFDHGPRYLAIYANHSTQPNAKFESVKVRKPGPLGLKYRMLLVSTEPIEAGCEIRVNYDAGLGRDSYWKVRAKRSRRRSFLTSTHLANLLSLPLSLTDRTVRRTRRIGGMSASHLRSRPVPIVRQKAIERRYRALSLSGRRQAGRRGQYRGRVVVVR